MRRKWLLGVAAAACAGFLAACTPRTVAVDGPTPAASLPRGVEGEWVSSDRLSVSRFAGGVFSTTGIDTGKKLADGNYTLTDSKTVQITVVSQVSKTTTAVTCAMVAQSQLNCTSSSGRQFVLTRRPTGET